VCFCSGDHLPSFLRALVYLNHFLTPLGLVFCFQDSKFRLILIESRVHRLARYYRLAKKLPPNWKYESATASTLVA